MIKAYLRSLYHPPLYIITQKEYKFKTEVTQYDNN